MTAQREWVQTPSAPLVSRKAWAWFLAAWTLSMLGLVWWLAIDLSEPGRVVMRLDSADGQGLAARLRNYAALARVNFHWTLGWLMLAPYVLWLGVHFPLDFVRWKSRATILILAGAMFVGFATTIDQLFHPRQAVVVMVNYSSTTDTRDLSGKPADVRTVVRAFATNLTTARQGLNQNPAWKEMLDLELSQLRHAGSVPTNLPPLMERLTPPEIKGNSLTARRAGSPFLDLFAYVALLGLAHAGVYHRRYREREQHAAQLASSLNEARLRALQAQLQPHFLFNTLNGIATLLHRDPAAAEEMLTSLSELLRVALSGSSRQEIPLREELDFLRRYLDIQQMRFGDRLQSTEQISADCLSCLVPTLILQPLVENAIRHGIEPTGEPGKVRVGAHRSGEGLYLVVEDNGAGFGHGLTSPSQTGLGLSNVRERLATLYGHAGKLSFEVPAGGGVRVVLELPIRRAEDPESVRLEES